MLIKKYRIYELIIIFFVLQAFFFKGYSQSYYAKIKGGDGISNSFGFKWEKDLKLDYVVVGNGDYSTKLLITFNPDVSRYITNGSANLTPFLSKVKSWIEDRKTKNKYFMVKDEFLVYDNDFLSNPRFELYPYAGKIKFILSFDKIPEEVKEFDVYLDGEICFKNIKLKETKTDFDSDQAPSESEYRNSKITLVNCLKGKYLFINANGYDLTTIMPRMHGKNEYYHYSNFSVTILFPKNYSKPVSLKIESKNGNELYEASVMPTIDGYESRRTIGCENEKGL